MVDYIEAQLENYIISKNSHFQMGKYYHSDSFVMLKQFFENSNNSIHIGKALADLFNSKFNPQKKEVLFVGYKNFLSLTLQTLCRELNIKCSYNTVELHDGNFNWSNTMYNSDNNLLVVIVLPISSSPDTYIKLKNFLLKQFDSKSVGVFDRKNEISKHFISIIQVLDEEVIKGHSNESRVMQLKQLYDSFGWKININQKEIQFPLQSNNLIEEHTTSSLVIEYRTLYPRKFCGRCYVDNSCLVKTNPKSDDLDVLFKIGDYFKRSSSLTSKEFLHYFEHRQKPSLIYSNLKVNDTQFSNFIYSRNFYANNKFEILKYFSEVFNDLECEDKVKIITPSFVYSSNFIEEFILECDALQNKEVNILRVTLSEDYLDYFLSSLTISELKDTTVIYFEDVLSGASNLKRISEYLKVTSGITDKRRGIDYIFTLIDRTNFYTHRDLIKRTNKDDQLYSFLDLNVPITSVSHLGDPFTKLNKFLISIFREVNLRIIESKITADLNLNEPKTFETLSDKKDLFKKLLDYTPFSTLNQEEFKDFKVDSYNFNLLRFLLLHLINNFISEKTPEINKDFIKQLFERLFELRHQLLHFFVKIKNEEASLVALEIAKEQCVKHLTSHPYNNFQEIRVVVSEYIIEELKQMDAEIEKNGRIVTFEEFRRYKFFISRSVNLELNYIISESFLSSLRLQYSKDRIEEVLKHYGKEVEKNKYELRQITTYFSFLLFKYKILLRQDNYKSLMLEKILLSEKVNPDPEEDLIKFLNEPFNSFKGMLVCENNTLLVSLLDDKIIENLEGGVKKLSSRYFDEDSNKKDPIIVLNRDLILLNDPDKSYKLSLATAKFMKLASKINTYDKSKLFSSDNFKSKIKSLVDEYVDILRVDNIHLDYIFVYRSNTNLDNKDFSFFGTQTEDSKNLPEFVTEGLINNYLNGLGEFHFDPENSIQTLIPIVKIDQQYHSYTKRLFSKNKADLIIEEAIDKDVKSIPLLQNAKMFIAYRLSWIDFFDKSACIILFSNSKANKDSFKHFCNDSKLRLMLTLKDTLLTYLHSQFEDGGYEEYARSEKKLESRKGYEHNLRGTLSDLEWCYKKGRIKSSISKKNDLEFDLNLKNIRSQTLKFNKSEYSILQQTTNQVREYIEVLFSFKSIGKYAPKNNWPTFTVEAATVSINEAILEIVIPEIVSNMKKHAPRIQPDWKINITKDKIEFSNNILLDAASTNRGIEICGDIMKVLKMSPITHSKKNNRYKVVLKF